MDYEREYIQALSRAKCLYNKVIKENLQIEAEDIRAIFPEIKKHCCWKDIKNFDEAANAVEKYNPGDSALLGYRTYQQRNCPFLDTKTNMFILLKVMVKALNILWVQENGPVSAGKNGYFIGLRDNADIKPKDTEERLMVYPCSREAMAHMGISDLCFLSMDLALYCLHEFDYYWLKFLES